MFNKENPLSAVQLQGVIGVTEKSITQELDIVHDPTSAISSLERVRAQAWADKLIYFRMGLEAASGRMPSDGALVGIILEGLSTAGPAKEDIVMGFENSY